MMSRLRHSIQEESRPGYSVLTFTHLQEMPVAESSGPIGGKQSRFFSKRGAIDWSESLINCKIKGRVCVLGHLAPEL